MAKAKAPLFSFRARGSVGKVLTFRESARQHVVSTVPLHPDARSAAQLAQRARYLHAKTYWHTLTATEKAQLLTQARPDNITGYNLLLRRYLKDLLNLEAWWPLNDLSSGVATDFSLHQTDGTVFGCIAAPDFCGQVNNAFFFDGINDHILTPAPQLNFTTHDFTLTYRIYPLDFTAHGVVMCRGAWQIAGWYTVLESFQRIAIYTNQLGADQVSASSGGGLSLATWYTVGITRQGPSVRIYINGLDDTETVGNHLDPSTSVATLVTGFYVDLVTDPLPARLCDVKAFSRALTPAEHLSIHQRACVPPV